MKVLVIGGGGREHTLVWKLRQSPQVKGIYCAPGNGGIARHATCVPIAAEDIAGLVDFARRERVGLTVVGPEAPLCAGLVDAFQAAGLRVFGPNAKAARMEGSKIFAKELMSRHNVPTAPHRVFDSADEAAAYVRQLGRPVVVKADGLAAGKGVIVCANEAEALAAVDRTLREQTFGEAGSHILIEERLVGEEASVLAFVSGESFVLMDSSQDHKPVFDGDKGPNTGGMGAYSPAPIIDELAWARIRTEVFERIVGGMASEGLDFRGVLYAGIMMTGDGPQVLEFNVRFGDPETQALLPRLEDDLVDVLCGVIDGSIERSDLCWSSSGCICVVMASGGYPGAYAKGKVITGIEDAEADPDVVVFHAGTKLDGHTLVTAGGRVVGVTARGRTLESAIETAYNAVEMIHFDGAHFRTDIGAKAIR
ncbi:MAG: phosphoribosylamine--glycine ligase [Verrucomicrobia bacterium]|nr:phosphoribosylamine--glycine ligase [Verrucomicrobiota bacterium]